MSKISKRSPKALFWAIFVCVTFANTTFYLLPAKAEAAQNSPAQDQELNFVYNDTSIRRTEMMVTHQSAAKRIAHIGNRNGEINRDLKNITEKIENNSDIKRMKEERRQEELRRQAAMQYSPSTNAEYSSASGRSMTVTVTAYSSTPDQCSGNPFITASGTHVHWGTIAFNGLAFGTKVKFPDYFGDQVFTVEDRTSTRYSGRADIWFSSRGEAIQFGKRTLRMEIL